MLLAVAAPSELRAVLRGLGVKIAPEPRAWTTIDAGRFDVVLAGVGKANAAGAVARLLDPSRHAGVLSVGVAGALPGGGLALGAVVCARACVFADEGVETPDRFIGCAELGFPPAEGLGQAIPATLGGGVLAAAADAEGVIATVSTCSGTDEAARRLVERTGAVAEAMEGAAAALAAHRLGLPAGELRVISNTTGARASQRWDLPGALARLERVIGLL